jgi:hypothetical protein
MSNVIKYSNTYISNTLRKGNIAIGSNNVDYSPTVTTNFYSGKTPPNNGYTIYFLDNVNNLHIRTASSDSEMITIATQFGGTNINTISNALNYMSSLSTVNVVDRDIENIVTNGLVYYTDASLCLSYPKGNSTLYDLSGNANNSTLQNSPSFVTSTGATGNYIQYASASSQYATIPELGDLTNFTVCCWVYFNSVPTSNTYPALITNQYDLVSKVNYALGVLNATWDGKIAGGYYNSGWKITAGFTPSINTWYHVAVTYDGNTITLYQNGSSYSTTSSTTSALSSGLGGYIARRWDSAEYINGIIPIVSIYNRALSTSEILQNYNAHVSKYSSGVISSGLVMNLSTAPSSGTNWVDSSGNGNVGTVNGTFTYVSNNGGGITTTAVGNSYISTAVNLTNTFTVSMVASLSPGGYWATWWGNDNYNSGKGYFAYMPGTNNLEFGSVTGGSVYSTGGSHTGIHVWDFVLNGTSYVIYKDGVSVSTGSITAPSGGSSTVGTYFGARHGNTGTSFTDLCPGTYYSMRIYNRYLSSTEISSNYTTLKSIHGL